MVTILTALRQVREDLAHIFSRQLIEAVCTQAGHRWRRRVCDPFTTIHLFILQVLNGNFPCSGLPHLADVRLTASAYCQARQRLPLEVFRRLLAMQVEHLNTEHRPESTWRGHRLVIVDGSGFSMPDTPALQKHFGQPGQQKPGCGFPVAHMLAVMEAGSGLLLDLLAFPLRTHDMRHVRQCHARLQADDIMLVDRGFSSYAHLALILKANLHVVMRTHQKQIIDFRPHRAMATKRNAKGRPRSRWLKRVGHLDQLVEYRKPSDAPVWLNSEDYEALPDRLIVRELRYRVSNRGYRTRWINLVTTLLDPDRYPARELAELYRRRWEIETDLRHLKRTLGMDVLKCKSVDGVLKEMFMFAIAYNLVRLVMLQAGRRQQIAPDRVSFVDALRWLRHASPGKPLPELLVNPLRPDRIEPRVIKRRLKEYDLMKQPRAELRKRLRKRRDAA